MILVDMQATAVCPTTAMVDPLTAVIGQDLSEVGNWVTLSADKSRL